MKTLLSTLILSTLMSTAYSQNLSGEYFINGQGGEIVLRLQSAGGNQVTGTMTNPQNGQSSQFQFTRGAGAGNNTGIGFGNGGFGNGGNTGMNNTGAERDQRIIGNWLYTDSYTSGEFSFASQQRLIIRPDGTFWLGDGKMAGGGPGIGGSSGGGGEQMQGQWKTQGNNTILVLSNTGQWSPLCRYEANGQSILMYFNDGSKQLWRRN